MQFVRKYDCPLLLTTCTLTLHDVVQWPGTNPPHLFIVGTILADVDLCIRAVLLGGKFFDMPVGVSDEPKNSLLAVDGSSLDVSKMALNTLRAPTGLCLGVEQGIPSSGHVGGKGVGTQAVDVTHQFPIV